MDKAELRRALSKAEGWPQPTTMPSRVQEFERLARAHAQAVQTVRGDHEWFCEDHRLGAFTRLDAVHR